MRKSGEKAERLFQRFNDSRRIAGNHDIVTKTLSNNSTGRDNDVVTECHAWVDGCMPPIQQLLPIVIGLANSLPLARSTGSSG